MRIAKLFIALVCALSVFLLAPSAWAYFDLTVTSLNVVPASPAQGEPVTITATVKNVGESPSPDSALSSYQANFRDFTMEGSQLPAAASLAPNGSVSFRFSGFFSSIGTKRVYFLVNPGEEGGAARKPNYLEKDISVLKPYDLNVAEISLHPIKPAKNQYCQILVKITNSGYARIHSAAQGFNAYSFDFQDFVKEKELRPTVDSSKPLESGQSVYYVYEGRFSSEGEKELGFSIDKNNLLDEKNEENNFRAQKVKVASLNEIDIKVNNIIVEPVKPLVGEETVIKVEIVNGGSVSLVTDSGLRWQDNTAVVPMIKKDLHYLFQDFDSRLPESDPYPEFTKPLDPNGKFYYTFRGQFKAAGEKELEVFANINNRLREADTADNEMRKNVRVYAGTAERDSFDIVNLRVKPISSTAVEISWETDVTASSRLRYKQSDYTGWIDRNEKTGLVFFEELTGLKPGQSYDYEVTAANGTVKQEKKGLRFSAPANDNFEFSGPIDATIDGRNVQFRWQTTLRTLCSVFYRLFGAADWTERKLAVKDTVFQLSLIDIPDGDYEWYISALGPNEVPKKSSNKNFSVRVGNGGDQSPGQSEQPTPAPPAVVPDSSSRAAIGNQVLYQRLQGRIILTVEQNGEAYYIHPTRSERYYLGRPDDAFAIMREQGIGIKNADLAKIPVGLAPLTGPDSDGDGLSDLFEDAIGTDKNKPDTDGDGHTDKDEILAGYDPLGSGRLPYDTGFAKNHMGKIFLQVEKKGEAWYVSPQDGKRYFLGRPGDAFSVMRTLGLGIGNKDFSAL